MSFGTIPKSAICTKDTPKPIIRGARNTQIKRIIILSKLIQFEKIKVQILITIPIVTTLIAVPNPILFRPITNNNSKKDNCNKIFVVPTGRSDIFASPWDIKLKGSDPRLLFINKEQPLPITISPKHSCNTRGKFFLRIFMRFVLLSMKFIVGGDDRVSDDFYIIIYLRYLRYCLKCYLGYIIDKIFLHETYVNLYDLLITLL